MQINKTELREFVRAIRKKISNEKLKNISEKIAINFLNSDAYKRSTTILCYKSKEREVATDAIISQALKDRKRVALPKCEGRDIVFYEIKNSTKLVKGDFGILEPDSTLCKEVDDFSDSLCVLPCMCCDVYGYRLGYGGGFYDRFLEHFTGKKVVLCPRELVFSSIPHETFDISADWIISE